MHLLSIWILVGSSLLCLLSCRNNHPVRSSADENGHAAYQQGFIFQEQVQFQKALDNYRQAISQAEKTKDSCLLLQCHLQICRIYRYQSLKSDALASGIKATTYSRSLPNDSLARIICGELGDIYVLSGQTDSAAIYYRQALLWSKLAPLSIQQSDYSQAKDFLNKDITQSGGKISDDIALIFASLYMKTSRLDSAAIYLNKVSASNIQLLSYQADLARLRGDTLQAVFYDNSYRQQVRAATIQRNQEQVTQLLWHSETKNWQEQLETILQSNRRITYLWCVLVLAGGAGGFFLTYRRRNRKQDSEAEANFRHSEVYIRFHQKVEWKPRTQDWEELLQAFEQTYTGFYGRLKEKVPQLSQPEWYMCCLIKMEVPPSTMAMLFCCTYQAISMRRIRLYQKIYGEKGTPEQCDAYIREI